MPLNNIVLTSIRSYQIKRKVSFTSPDGDYPLTLTVGKEVSSRAGFTKIGRATHVFTFERAGATTRDATPTSDHRPPDRFDANSTRSESTSAFQHVTASATTTETAARDEGSTGGTPTEGSDTIVLVHDRYNGRKELYVNQVLVYMVKKECTDGNMNSWVIPLWFGKVVIRLTARFFSSSGFEYKLSLDDETVLYKAH